MGIKKTLDNLARGLALSFSLVFAGCGDTSSCNMPQDAQEIYTQIRTVSGADRRGGLEDYSKNKEAYQKEAGKYSWINKNNMKEEDKLYLVVQRRIEEALGNIYER